MSELDEISGRHSAMSAERRKKELGHPKELFERLHTACIGVKPTLETMPKLVERME